MTKKSEYLELYRTEEIIEDLETRGYKIAREVNLSGQIVDFVASRGEEKIGYEIKSFDRISREFLIQLEHTKQAAKRQGISKIELILVKKQVQKNIYIEGIEEMLLSHLSDNFPSELDQMSTHTYLEDVSGVDIEDIEIEKNGVTITGTCTVDVTLTYGSGSESERMGADFSFPAKFRIDSVGIPLKDADIEVEIDNSSFYEE